MRRKILTELQRWRAAAQPLPLLLNGARQVGKTYTLREFGQSAFEDIAYLNLEIHKRAAACFEESLEPETLLRRLEAVTGQRILPRRTLLILDEIQSCEEALTSLKYFAEEAPEYYVAAAGSLLGVAIHRERYSFPVGKVKALRLHPLDFEEYLWARGREALAETIRQSVASRTQMPDALHKEALALYREYLLLGGMPASLNAFLGSNSFLEAQEVQNGILDSYTADMAKYATPGEAVRIRACYDSIPAQLGKDNKKFQYKVVQRGGSAGIFGASLDWLGQAGLVLKCQRVRNAQMPLAAYADLSAFKIYMSDVGLLTAKSGLSQQLALGGEGNIFFGALTENYAAQQLTAAGLPLYYWENSGTAELDFLLQSGGAVIGAEVKAGEHTKSRSLNRFLQEYRPPYAIRWSTRNIGEQGQVLSLPLYAIFCLPAILI